jgi:hypothetical protein
LLIDVETLEDFGWEEGREARNQILSGKRKVSPSPRFNPIRFKS